MAIVSPSAGLPGLFPVPYELGLQRLREEFGLVPFEYPTTRQMNADPKDRAADLNSAFADPSITAIISTIGGDDQIRVLPYLDRALIAAHPKPFFGYSDNTCLLAVLWNAGVVGYHGSSVMFHLGRPLELHPATQASFEAALFGSGEYTLVEPARTGDVDLPWSDPETFRRERPSEPADPWAWHVADRVVEGIAWGGNLEVLSMLAMADREIGSPESYAGCVLIIETSESMPSDEQVYCILQSFGERGLLGQFPAVLVGRAKAWTTRRPLDPEAKRAFRCSQHDAIRRAFERYGQNPMIAFDVDFGHTEPQFVIPTGGLVRVDGIARKITVTY